MHLNVTDHLTSHKSQPIFLISFSLSNTQLPNYLSKMKMKAITLLCIYTLLCFTTQHPFAAAVTCDVSQLSPCMGPILYGSATPPACCSSLKMQQPCFCQYARNPTYSGYVYGSNGRRVASDCKVSLPRC
ncbi:Nonspecific lipid-transfer protein [Rhynchospora pubera]|uniref:Nonspecific lipid-transfer protein n=2 Tax=Rhynchospora pubera TaxID=906938 RepID=A0AAV8C004_9POAL|nr:Nonspecific lipid-transfer protein [Rhynchospora pubera]